MRRRLRPLSVTSAKSGDQFRAAASGPYRSDSDVGIFSVRVVFGSFEKAFRGFVERAELVVEDIANNGVIGVEVPVGEMVSHTSDRLPRDVRLGVEKIGVDRLDRLTNLDEPNPNGVVN